MLIKILSLLREFHFPYNKWEVLGYILSFLMPFPLGIFFGILLYKGLEKENKGWKRFFYDPGLRIIIFSIFWLIFILTQTLGKQYPWLYP